MKPNIENELNVMPNRESLALMTTTFKESGYTVEWYNACTLDLILFSFHSFMKNGVRKQNVFQSLSMIPLDDIATFT